jgi:hypothetical protein
MIPILRFVYDFLFVSGHGKIQSLIIGSALMTIGVLTFLLALFADLMNDNRALIEIMLEKVRRLEAGQSNLLRARENQPIPTEFEDGRSAEGANKRGYVVHSRRLKQQQK